MHIAMIAPPWFAVPPVGYGGIEAVVADLVDGLVGRGHEVTLVGAGRHGTRASRFVATDDRPPTERMGEAMPEVLHAAAVANALRDLDVDVVHDHSLAGPLLAQGREVPTVVTVHGPVSGEPGEFYDRLGSSVNLVAISRSQRRLNPGLNWVAVVHNAVDVTSFPFSAHKGDYVLWLGRFCADKGPREAVEAARAAGLRIVLAGKCSEKPERDYFASEIEPRLGPGVEYVGEADGQLKRRLLAGARALLFPIQWEEPFGMVMIEAMACGTPVVAMGRGSVPEVVEHGVSGWVVADRREMVSALLSLDDLDPCACRRHVEDRFAVPVMATEYERVYARLLGPGASHTAESTTRPSSPSAPTGPTSPVGLRVRVPPRPAGVALS